MTTSGETPAADSKPMELTNLKDPESMDKFIQSLMKCNPLSEKNVQLLCEHAKDIL